jgi:hypothetical protein
LPAPRVGQNGGRERLVHTAFAFPCVFTTFCFALPPRDKTAWRACVAAARMPLNLHRRTQRLAAWLALFAIWLTVLVPAGSQLLAREAPPEATLCSAYGHHASRGSEHEHATHRFDACGYCSLFSHCPALHGASCPDRFLPAAHGDEVAPPTHERARWFRCLWRAPRAPPALA